MPVNSNRAAVEARMAQAEEAGLIAAGNVYRNAMMQALIGGYTTGNYAHGFDGVAGSVSVSEVQQDGEGRFVTVGTNVPYAKHWELGHRNLFMWNGSGGGPPYVRVEKWRPTMEEKMPEINAKYADIYGKVMARG
jgi:hypothetical protein